MTIRHESAAGRRITSVEGRYRIWTSDNELIAEVQTYSEAAFAARQDAIRHLWRGQQEETQS